jgi:succinate dehydrogenase/fumarate reductase flavoprotein subunit
MDTVFADVLVIGAGAAGLRAAIAACKEDVNVVMVAADDVTHGGSTFSRISQGWGIQALVGEERTDENLEDFYNDIVNVGLGQCDPKLVRILVEESKPRTEDLMSYGLRFKK